MNLRHRLLFILFLLLTASCNVTKHLPEGEKLYAGSKVKVHTDGKKNASSLSTELKDLVRPKRNKTILGIRYKVYFYYVVGEPKGKGIRKLVREKLGEEPVFASSVNLEKNRQVLENRLQNRGYFHAVVTASVDTTSKKRLTTLKFEATTGPQYKIRTVTFPTDSTQLTLEINKNSKRSLLKTGKPYDLDIIKQERARIDLRLKNKGYYYFNPDYLLIRADTNVGEHQVDMYLALKQTTPLNDRVPYLINNIWVYPTYTIESDSLLGAAPAIKAVDYFVIDPEHKFKPKIFSRMLAFHPGEVYSRKDHNLSLNRLVNMGVFKFVKARFEEVDTNGYYLDPYYFLTPLPKKSWRLEVTGLTKSNNATGGEVSVNWRNRNLLRGAELFTASVFGGVEKQISGTESHSVPTILFCFLQYP